MQEANNAQPQAYNVKYLLASLQIKTGDKKSAIVSANEELSWPQQKIMRNTSV